MRTVLLLALALALPVGSATWSVSGSFEPDTPEDVLQGRMFAEPDVDPRGERVYFNAFPTDRTGAPLYGTDLTQVPSGVELNPNVGALRSRVLPPAAMSMTAWLGIWKDCNEDGYIGHVETAMVIYRSELLLDDTICPPGTRFNRFTWVSEFIYVSPQPQNLTATMPRVVWDPTVAVWGDFGRPQAEGERHFGCAEPLPRGALDSTGALLAGVDCHLSYTALRAVGSEGVLGIVPPFDGPGGPYHPEQDCDHPLNQHVGVYDNDPCAPQDPGLLEGDAAPMVTVWECSAGGRPDTIRVTDPFDRDRTWFGIGEPAQPTTPTVNDQGSLYGGVDHVLAQCDRGPPAEGLGEDMLTPDYVGTNPADPKRSADFVFDYDMPAGSVGVTPSNLGLRTERGAWNAKHTFHAPTYSSNLVRASDLQGVAAQWFTFYARVGPTVMNVATLPDASPALYGFEACEEDESGVRKGWDCDRDHWWSEAHGGVEDPDGPRPHDAYQLRDNDCYDGAVSDGSGVHAGGWLLTGDSTCPVMGPSLLG